MNIETKPPVQPAPFTSKEDLFKMLKDNLSYLSDEEISLIEKAYRYADEKHKGQKRKSGEEYIIHPLSVAIILSNLKTDPDTIIAGLLHDVVEDTGTSLDEIKDQFGEGVRDLVDGVTKLTQLNLVNDKVELQAENLRKMFLAMAKDIRVIIIKLADRLHNLRTLEYQSEEKQKEKALETLEIYSPIANRLGISKIKVNMDDLSLFYLHPKEYKDLLQKIKLRKESRQAFVDEKIKEIKNYLTEAGIDFEIYGRVKNLFSIYKKMLNRKVDIDQIYDLFALRIIVNDIKDCYACLGIIHEYYKPIPGRFKDYIAMPKQNGYQSLHTTVIGKEGIPFEIQIRTNQMHETAEYGIAAHWAYKEKGNSKGADQKDLKDMNWLREILEFNKEENDSKEFLKLVKSDLNLFTEKVYCFSPDGDVKVLPQGSTPVDFAYMIHSAVGNKMVGARINGALVPIDYVLKNGDQVNIITSANAKGPSLDWLKFVKSSSAKSKISHWFKTERRGENITEGRSQLLKYIKTKGYSEEELLVPEFIEACCKKYSCKDLDDIYAAIGHGGLKESQVVSKLIEELEKKKESEKTDADVLNEIESQKQKHTSTSNTSGVLIKGFEDLAVKFAKCCSPVPGDEIVGFVTRGSGITIHKTDCKNIMTLPDIERERLLKIEWADSVSNNTESYFARIAVYTQNKMGQVMNISRVMTENNVNILDLSSKVGKNDTGTIILGFNVQNKETLSSLMLKLKAIDGVIEVQRI